MFASRRSLRFLGVAAGDASALREPALTGADPAPNKAKEPAQSKGPIEAIAVAAYAYHRRRRSRIRTAPSHGAWETAGRIRQLARSEHRN